MEERHLEVAGPRRALQGLDRLPLPGGQGAGRRLGGARGLDRPGLPLDDLAGDRHRAELGEAAEGPGRDAGGGEGRHRHLPGRPEPLERLALPPSQAGVRRQTLPAVGGQAGDADRLERGRGALEGLRQPDEPLAGHGREERVSPPAPRPPGAPAAPGVIERSHRVGDAVGEQLEETAARGPRTAREGGAAPRGDLRPPLADHPGQGRHGRRHRLARPAGVVLAHPEGEPHHPGRQQGIVVEDVDQGLERGGGRRLRSVDDAAGDRPRPQRHEDPGPRLRDRQLRRHLVVEPVEGRNGDDHGDDAGHRR